MVINTTAMLIGELAQKTNVSRHTIRFYEKLGLIEVPRKSRRDNNYKEYPDDVVKRIDAIQKIKAQGFTLKEAKGIIYLISTGTLDPARGRQYILQKVKKIEKQIEQLQHIKHNLQAMANQCERETCTMSKIIT